MFIDKKEKEWFKCRDILWVMVFFGFGMNYMLRININIAIVAMVIPRPKPAASVQCNPEISTNLTDFKSNITLLSNPTNSSMIISRLPADQKTEDSEIRYAWNEYEQGLILGAYYWSHWVSQLPGGLLARKYGTKKVLGLGNFIPALLGYFIPFATRQHLYFLVFIRALQGLIAGVVWPSMHSMTAKWIPPNERSKFVSSYLGSSVGAAIAYPLCAAIISSLGWEAVFTVTSTIGVAWFCLWLYLVYDSPREHPRISKNEKNAILQQLTDSVTTRPTKVPWKSILTSGPVWITCIAQWGTLWGIFTFMTQAPSYFNFVHGWNVNATGVLSGVPHLLRTIFSYVFSIFCDWLLRAQKLSRTNVRKLATFMCTGVQGLFTLGLAFSGCHPYLAAAFMMAGTASNGAISSGILPAFVDLSPNFASVLLGFSGMVNGATGYLSAFSVSALTNNNQTIGQWRIVYLIAVLNLAISCMIFTIFGTAEEQPWNRYYSETAEKDDEEMHTINGGHKCDEDAISDDNTNINCEEKERLKEKS